MKAIAGWRRMSRTKRENWFWGYSMIAPAMLGIGFFFIWPMIQTFYFSLTRWGSFGAYKFAGFDNYDRLFADPDVWKAVLNTFRYVVLAVPLSIAISIIVAAMLNQSIKGLSLYRTLFFLPVITMPAAVAMVWKWLYNSDFGLLNQMLNELSIQGPRWLTDARLAPYSIIVVMIWSRIGFNMVILLAGLQGISKTYYEAAKIDGAGVVAQFLRITLPGLTPTIFFVFIISLIGTLQEFDLIWMMVGNPSIVKSSTQSVVYLFYDAAFLTNEKGYAASIAVLIFILVMVMTTIQMVFQRKWIHYE